MSQTKLPAIQFYTGDWMKDPAVRSVSLSARGLWIDMLCLMFESPRRGYLQHGTGNPVLPEQLARMTGCSAEQVSHLLTELNNSGVFSSNEHGIIFSRRMVKDERKRIKCIRAGHLGGNPTLKGQVKGRLKRKPTPSSSTSTSTSVEEKEEEKDVGASVKGRHRPIADIEADPAFSAFWDAWPRDGCREFPAYARKKDRFKCALGWSNSNFSKIADEIMRGLAAAKRSKAWKADKGKFIPLPMTWLNGRRWVDAIENDTVNGEKWEDIPYTPE